MSQMNRREFLQLGAKAAGVVAVAAMLPQVAEIAPSAKRITLRSTDLIDWPEDIETGATLHEGEFFDLRYDNVTVTYVGGSTVRNCMFTNCKIRTMPNDDGRVLFEHCAFLGNTHLHCECDNTVVQGGIVDFRPVETNRIGVGALDGYGEYTAA